MCELRANFEIESIEHQRQDLLENLVGQLHDLSQRLSSGTTCGIFACRSMLLGALTQDMCTERLYSPRPSRPFCDMGLSSTIRAVRSFESPTLYLPGLYGGSPDFWALQKDPYSSSSRKKKHRNAHHDEGGIQTGRTPEYLVEHQCDLQNLLKPAIDSLEAKIEGLELSASGRHWT